MDIRGCFNMVLLDTNKKIIGNQKIKLNHSSENVRHNTQRSVPRGRETYPALQMPPKKYHPLPNPLHLILFIKNLNIYIYSI